MERSIQAIWNQEDVPVILRRTGKGELLRVRLPFDPNNRLWLQNMRRTTPSWIASRKFWEIPKAWFDDFVNRALKKYGSLYVIQPYREQEICSSSCQNAQGHECQCSCMGVHHGAGSDGSWFEVSEAFSTRWGERELACRLMVAKKQQQAGP